jgi:glutamate racemase
MAMCQDGAVVDGTDRPRVGVFDAGIGGVPLAARLHELIPCQVVYLGDAARRPYGPQPGARVAGYVAQAEEFFFRQRCDLWVVACNTASVVVDMATRDLLPRIDMISAVRATVPTTDRPIGLVGTAGTVRSGAFPRALSGRVVHQIATEELLRLAEEGGGDAGAVRALAGSAFDELRDLGCRHVILACTDFTCILTDLHQVADDLALIDPLEEAARLAVAHLRAGSRQGRGSAVDPAAAATGAPLPGPTPGAGDEVYLTGPHPVDVAAYAHDRFGLSWPEPTFVELAHPALMD